MTNSAKMMTLWCKHGEGHAWERASQRGKPPHFCPEHKPATVVSSTPKAPKVKVESIAAKRNRDMAEVDGTPWMPTMPTEEQLAAERERERRKALAKRETLEQEIVSLAERADAACKANLKAMDALGARPTPEALKEQEQAFKSAIGLTARLRNMREQHANLEVVAA